MARDLVRHNRPVFDHVHPRIFTTAVGLVAWFIFAAWLLFDHKFDSVDDMALPLGMASLLLILTVVLLSTLTSMTSRHVLSRDGVVPNISFQDWKHGDFAVWGSRIKSTHAAIDILLPLVSAAVGLTAIGVVFLICATTAT